MHLIRQLALALSMALASQSYAQTSNTIRLNPDGNGTSLLPPALPLRSLSGPLDVDPEAMQAPADENNGAESKAPARAAPSSPPPPAQVQENPRTMITRDRIESPQH